MTELTQAQKRRFLRDCALHVFRHWRTFARAEWGKGWRAHRYTEAVRAALRYDPRNGHTYYACMIAGAYASGQVDGGAAGRAAYAAAHALGFNPLASESAARARELALDTASSRGHEEAWQADRLDRIRRGMSRAERVEYAAARIHADPTAADGLDELGLVMLDEALKTTLHPIVRAG